MRTGLAWYGEAGRLLAYRSQNFGTRARLKRGARGAVREHAGLRWLVLEGDRTLGQVWTRAAEPLGASVRIVTAETWRRVFLRVRERHTGQIAKQNAGRLARAVIAWSGLARPTSLRHDAAEAILIGLWGALSVGWLSALPPALDRG